MTLKIGTASVAVKSFNKNGSHLSVQLSAVPAKEPAKESIEVTIVDGTDVLFSSQAYFQGWNFSASDRDGKAQINQNDFAFQIVEATGGEA